MTIFGCDHNFSNESMTWNHTGVSVCHVCHYCNYYIICDLVISSYYSLCNVNSTFQSVGSSLAVCVAFTISYLNSSELCRIVQNWT